MNARSIRTAAATFCIASGGVLCWQGGKLRGEASTSDLLMLVSEREQRPVMDHVARASSKRDVGLTATFGGALLLAGGALLLAAGLVTLTSRIPRPAESA